MLLRFVIPTYKRGEGIGLIAQADRHRDINLYYHYDHFIIYNIKQESAINYYKFFKIIFLIKYFIQKKTKNYYLKRTEVENI